MTNSRANPKANSTRDLILDANKKLFLDGGTDTYIRESSSDSFQIVVGNQPALHIKETGDVVDVVCGRLQVLATTATDGFLYIPACNGVPTGTPTGYTGKVAIIYDVTNNDLYIYDGSWLKADNT